MSEKPTNRGQQWLVNFLEHFGWTAEVSLEQPEIAREALNQFGGCWLTIEADNLSPEQEQSIKGDQGQVLDAIQYLLNSTLNLGQPQDAQEAYTVEFSGFRSQRYTELASLAQAAAVEVRQTHGEHEMPPLSSAERRLVHTVLYEAADLDTFSRGEGRNRRLVVRFVDSDQSPE